MADNTGHRLTVRLDERTNMLLTELADRRKVSRSVVVRALLMRTLDELLNEKGDWHAEEHEN